MSALSTAANVLNAQQSTGPKTPEGKEHSKFNALKTGIYARSILLPDEDQAAFDAIGSYLTASLEPQNEEERNLVTTIQNTNWRLQRIVELEFSLYAIESHKQLDAVDAQFGAQAPHARQALARAAAFAANLKAFEQISRQEGRLQRILERAQRELSSLMSQRVSVPIPAPAPEPTQPPVKTAVPQSGFVSSKYPAHMPIFSGAGQRRKRLQWLKQNGYKNLM
jgi:hypothetical protein